MLLTLDSTLHSGLNGSNTLEATLTFDRPVALDLLLDGQDQIADKSIFQTTWTLSQTPAGRGPHPEFHRLQRAGTIPYRRPDRWRAPSASPWTPRPPVLEAGGATEDSLESTSGRRSALA